MSSSISTRSADGSDDHSVRIARRLLRPIRLTALRVVEAQHQVSTRKLVDSLEEQALLEQLIETAKPPTVPASRLHVLLSTPFRYPPLRHGSRFGTRHESGIWYGSEHLRTLCSEVAYYRLVFLDGTSADLGDVTSWHTVFSVRIRTERGVDLTLPPFAAHRQTISSPSAYAESQKLGRAMRDAGVELFRYFSARDDRGGVNVGVLAPEAFGASRPRNFETWHCTANRDRVELVQRDFFELVSFVFTRDAFLVDGQLPAPAF
jgi:hypothetical protein